MEIKNKINCNSKISLIFCIVICIIPFLFFTEESLLRNKELISLLDNFTSFFSGVENFAVVSEPYGIYYYTKLQLMLVLIGIIVLIPFKLYYIIKLYLRSFGYINTGDFSLKIKKEGTFSSLKHHLALTFLLLFGIEYLFLNSISQFSESYFLIYVYSNKFGLLLLSMILLAGLPCLISLMLIEGLAHFKKFLNKKF